MKVNFNIKLKDDELKKIIIENFPSANIVHISRSGDIGTIELSNVEDALKQNIQNSLNVKVPDIQIKSEVKKILTKEEVKAMNLKRLEFEVEDDEEDIQPTLDFNNMLNQQINMHVKKAKKNIKDLYIKLSAVIDEYNTNAGSFANAIEEIKRNIATKAIENENDIEKLMSLINSVKDELLNKILMLNGRLDELDTCIEKSISILNSRKK